MSNTEKNLNLMLSAMAAQRNAALDELVRLNAHAQMQSEEIAALNKEMDRLKVVVAAVSETAPGDASASETAPAEAAASADAPA